MSTVQEFEADLLRMGTKNGAWIDPQRVIPFFADEISQGARFVNVIRSQLMKKEHLLITSASTSLFNVGAFGIKRRWIILHEDLQDVDAARRVEGGGYVRDFVALRTNGRTVEFTTGFNATSSSARVMRDFAENNVGVAAREIQAQLAGTRQPIDPDLAALHRSMSLIDSGPTPDTEPSSHWGEADYERLFDWLCDAVDDGRQKAIWDRRIALGYGLGQGSATQEQWFWINALPALAGIEVGLKEHPMTATFAGLAEQSFDQRAEDQWEAMETIRQRFFA